MFIFLIHKGVRTKKGINQRIVQTTIMDLPAVAVGSGNDSPPRCLQKTGVMR